MFAILIPVSLSPLIITLLWAERKAKRLSLAPKKVTESSSFIRSVWEMTQKFDVIGLLLLGTSVALILLPLTLAGKAKGGWSNRTTPHLLLVLMLNIFCWTASMIAMLVVGIVVLPIFAAWDFRFSKYPIVPRRFLINRSIMFASGIGFFDFVSIPFCAGL